MSNISNPQPTETATPVVTKDPVSSQSLPTSTPFEVQQFLGVNEFIGNTSKDQLKTIYEVAMIDASDMGDVLKNISVLKDKIGHAYTGEEAINRLYPYAKLLKNRLELNKKIKAYEVTT